MASGIHTPPVEIQPMLTLQECANVMRCTPDTVMRFIRAGKLPATRPGKRPLVKVSDLDAMLRSSSANTDQ